MIFLYNYFPQYQNQYRPQVPQMPAQPQNATNKIYVTSQDDALARFSDPGSTMVYTRQDEQQEYEVTTDYQGRKSIIIYNRAVASGQPVNAVSEYVTAEQFRALESRFEALSKMVNGGERNE